jgi:hypothetical protein
MSEIVLSEPEKNGFKKALDDCIKWGKEHQAEVGIAEMALGAGIIYWGLQSGLIDVGKDILGSKLADFGGIAGAGIGGVASPILAGTLLKSIFIGGVSGVAGITLVPAIPVLALIGGGAAIFGCFGYTASGLAAKFFKPNFADYAGDASIIAVGLALMVDGARRIIKDARVLSMASNFKDGVIRLSSESSEIVARSWDELQSMLNELAKSPEGLVTSGTAAVVGGAIGGSLATASVTVLGSQGVGAVALSLGLVSAPVWPVVAGAAAGLAVGVAAWQGIKHLKHKTEAPKPMKPALLPPPL